MQVTRAVSTMLILVCTAACHDAGGSGHRTDTDGSAPGDADSSGDAVGDTGPGDTVVVDPATWHCGMPAFDWLPTMATGAVLEDQDIYDWPLWQVVAAQSYIGDESGVHLTRVAAHDVQLHRIRYQTQDRGQLIEATGMVVFPDESGPASFPVLLFLHGTCGFNDLCAPSRGIEDTQNNNYFNAALLGLFSSWGYIVVAPDYIGMKSLGTTSPELHPYLVGEPTAIASWDAVRASLSVVETATGQDTTSQPVLVWGASQGGHAASFAVRLAPHYAPEFTIAGSVWAIPPTNLLAHTQAALTSIRKASANTVAFLATGEEWYGPLPTGLSPVMKAPYDTAIQPDLKASCSPSTLDGVSALDQVFTDTLLSAVAAGTFDTLQPWYCMAEQNSLPSTAIPRGNDIPTLMILGEVDDLVDPAIERASFATLCSQGDRIELKQCAGAAHTEAFFWSIDDALDFLDARIAGLPMEEPCVEHAASTCQNTP